MEQLITLGFKLFTTHVYRFEDDELSFEVYTIPGGYICRVEYCDRGLNNITIKEFTNEFDMLVYVYNVMEG